MKAKHFVTLFFIVGLVFAITGIAGPAMAQDEFSPAIAADTGSVTEGVAAGGKIEEDIAPNAALPMSYLRVTGSVFKPRSDDVGWTASSQGGSVYANSGNPNMVWNTPLCLPQGTLIRYVRMYYYDNSANYCVGWFIIYDLWGDIVDYWPAVSSGTPGNAHATTDDIDHTIDYNLYSYTLSWRPMQIGSTMMLHGFRVFYYPSGTRAGNALILADPPPY